MTRSARFEDGRRVDGLATLTDIAPTVVELLGYDVTGGEYPGHPLTDLPEDRTLKFSCWYDDKCVASLQREMKYIHHFGERPDEAFDFGEDLLEKNNLADERPELVEERHEELFDWREENDGLYR